IHFSFGKALDHRGYYRAGLSGELQELVPLWGGALDSAHHPYHSARSLGTNPELPAQLGQSPAALAVIALLAAGHQVIPAISTTQRLGVNMVNGGGVIAAIATAIHIAPQHPTPGDRHPIIMRKL